MTMLLPIKIAPNEMMPSKMMPSKIATMNIMPHGGHPTAVLQSCRAVGRIIAATVFVMLAA
ncbi:MAG: hypothetical protein VW828_04635, partial [Candidatus Puniceispirillum sp.]